MKILYLEILGGALAVALVVWGVYKLFTGGAAALTGLGSGTGAPGDSATLASKAVDQLGIGTSSLTYSNAAEQTVSSPLSTFESILGFSSEAGK
jgi:hypothetical protein